jgi:hypothetical protein
MGGREEYGRKENKHKNKERKADVRSSIGFEETRRQ